MDDDVLTPAELREIARTCEGTLRCLHKELRRTGHPEASYAALEAADSALVVARALEEADWPPPPAQARRTSRPPAATAWLHAAQ